MGVFQDSHYTRNWSSSSCRCILYYAEREATKINHAPKPTPNPPLDAHGPVTRHREGRQGANERPHGERSTDRDDTLGLRPPVRRGRTDVGIHELRRDVAQRRHQRDIDGTPRGPSSRSRQLVQVRGREQRPSRFDERRAAESTGPDRAALDALRVDGNLLADVRGREEKPARQMHRAQDAQGERHAVADIEPRARGGGGRGGDGWEGGRRHRQVADQHDQVECVGEAAAPTAPPGAIRSRPCASSSDSRVRTGRKYPP